MQRALIDCVTPNLRAVVIYIDRKGIEEVFHTYYYYEGELSEELLDLWQSASTEGTGDFWGMMEEHYIRLDPPTEIPLNGGNFAYLRKESFLPRTFGQEISYDPLFTYGSARLALLSALLGKVTEELRAVLIDVDLTKKWIYIHFYHDGSIEEATKKLWEQAIQEVKITLQMFPATVEGEITRIDYTGERFRGEKGICIYHRKE
jgi:hypothetical protein